MGVQLQGALPPPPSGVYLRSELWAELPWDPATSSTARRWAPTEAPCPACRSAGAARRKPGRDPGWRWWRRRSGRSCAPSRGPFPPLSSAPRAVEEEEKIKRRFTTQRFYLSHVVLHGSEMLLWQRPTWLRITRKKESVKKREFKKWQAAVKHNLYTNRKIQVKKIKKWQLCIIIIMIIISNII